MNDYAMNTIYINNKYLLFTSAWADGSKYAASSALSSGKWVKVQVEDRGFYKLTYADLRGMGFSDPAKVSVHGYGGCMLDEDFSTPYIDDVPAVPVWRGDDFFLLWLRGLSNGIMIKVREVLFIPIIPIPITVITS